MELYKNLLFFEKSLENIQGNMEKHVPEAQLPVRNEPVPNLSNEAILTFQLIRMRSTMDYALTNTFTLKVIFQKASIIAEEGQSAALSADKANALRDKIKETNMALIHAAAGVHRRVAVWIAMIATYVTDYIKQANSTDPLYLKIVKLEKKSIKDEETRELKTETTNYETRPIKLPQLSSHQTRNADLNSSYSAHLPLLALEPTF